MSSIAAPRHALSPPSRSSVAELQRADARCWALTKGLSQLAREELLRLAFALREPGRVLLDTGNYDPGSGLWCPLAVGLGVPHLVASGDLPAPATAEEGKAALERVGRELRGSSFALNPISGIGGSFYRDSRYEDLRGLTLFLLDT